MKIAVCVKRVPEPGDVEVSESGEINVRTGTSMLNLFDTYAIEEAVRIKEATGAEAMAISLAEREEDVDVIKEAISYGLDGGVLLLDPRWQPKDAMAAGILVGKAVEKLGADLILTGMQTTDYGSGLFGGMLAQVLRIPWFSGVKKMERDGDGAWNLEIGWGAATQRLKTAIPAVVSVSREINEPRMRTVKGMMKAKKAKIPVWDNGELGLSEKELSLINRKTFETIRLEPPPPKIKGKILEGDLEQQIEQLLAVFPR